MPSEERKRRERVDDFCSPNRPCLGRSVSPGRPAFFQSHSFAHTTEPKALGLLDYLLDSKSFPCLRRLPTRSMGTEAFSALRPHRALIFHLISAVLSISDEFEALCARFSSRSSTYPTVALFPLHCKLCLGMKDNSEVEEKTADQIKMLMRHSSMRNKGTHLYEEQNVECLGMGGSFCGS